MLMQAERPPKKYYTSKVHRRVMRTAKQNKQQRVTYRTHNGVRHGWLVEDTGKVYKLRYPRRNSTSNRNTRSRRDRRCVRTGAPIRKRDSR